MSATGSPKTSTSRRPDGAESVARASRGRRRFLGGERGAHAKGVRRLRCRHEPCGCRRGRVLALRCERPVGARGGTATLEVFPTEPRVGELATVQVRTFVLLDRFAPTPSVYNEPLGVGATSQRRRELRVRLVRESGDPYPGAERSASPHGASGHSVPSTCERRAGTASCSGHNLPGADGQLQVLAKRARVNVWHRLQRPLHIPSIAGGSPCPTSSTDANGDLSRIGFAGLAWGGGPAYPGGLNAEEGKPVLRYLDPIPPESLFYGSKWFGNKVLWMVDRVYRGPVLVRGRQFDGPNELRFERSVLPPRGLRIPDLTRDRPSFTRVRARPAATRTKLTGSASATRSSSRRNRSGNAGPNLTAAWSRGEGAAADPNGNQYQPVATVQR